MSAIIEFIAVAVIGKMLVPAGTKLVREIIHGVSKAGTNPYTKPALRPIKQLHSLDAMRSSVEVATSRRSSRDAAAAKRYILDTLAATPLYVHDPERFRGHVDALRNAVTLDDVKTAGIALNDFALVGHHQLVISGVQTAVQNAAANIGFGNIEALRSPLGNSMIRLAATDESGRSIVTEIEARPDRDLKIEAEVVGVTDNSCEEILTRFYSALSKEGIVMMRPPKRKPTGGICELAATKAFLAKKLKPTRTHPRIASEAEATADDDRRVRINRSAASQVKAKLTR